MVRGVIFDMDGLMFDTERMVSSMWKKAGEAVHVDISMDFLDSFRGRNPAAIKEMFLEKYGREFEYERCRNIKTQLQYEHVYTKGVPIKKGLFELLEYLKDRGIKMAVATSTSRKLADTMLEKAGAAKYFDAFVYGDQVERSKPAPDIFLRAAEEIGVPMKECLVLEDSVAGVEAGKAAGGYIIHIPDIIVVPEHVKAGITAELKSLDEVIGWIESRV